MNLDMDKINLRAPICITWQITGKCNLSCIHCLSETTTGEKQELNINEVKHFIDDLANMKVFYINVGGGEPLIHPNFFEIVDYAREKGIFIQFSTNGTLINTETATEIANRELRVQVSIDGWSAAVNDSIRGKGSFRKAVKALKLLRGLDVAVSINCVVTRENLPGLDNLYQLATAYGAKLRLSRLRPSGRAHDKWRDLVPGRRQYLSLYNWLKKHPEVTTGDSFFFLSPFGESLPGLSFCGAGKLTCSVSSTGDVYPCAFTAHPSMAAGNVKEKPLSQLWQDKVLLKKVQESKPKLCTSCLSYHKCRGGCRGATYLVHGSWEMPDPECIRGEIDEECTVQ